MKSKSELVYQRTMLLSATDFLLGGGTGEMRAVKRRDGELLQGRHSQDERAQPKLVTG